MPESNKPNLGDLKALRHELEALRVGVRRAIMIDKAVDNAGVFYEYNRARYELVKLAEQLKKYLINKYGQKFHTTTPDGASVTTHVLFNSDDPVSDLIAMSENEEFAEYESSMRVLQSHLFG